MCVAGGGGGGGGGGWGEMKREDVVGLVSLFPLLVRSD